MVAAPSESVPVMENASVPVAVGVPETVMLVPLLTTLSPATELVMAPTDRATVPVPPLTVMLLLLYAMPTVAPGSAAGVNVGAALILRT